MFLSDFSIKRPVAAIVIIITLMGLGLIALNKLRVNQIPDVEQPVMVVSITYPGASPDTVEREIVNRIERALQGIEGVDQSRSSSSARREISACVCTCDDRATCMMGCADGSMRVRTGSRISTGSL